MSLVSKPSSPEQISLVSESSSLEQMSLVSKPSSPKQMSLVSKPSSPEQMSLVSKPSSPEQISLVSESSSLEQMSLVSESSSPEKMQLLFTPLMFASEPSGTLTSSMLPVEILRKIGEFASVETMRNLIATCKYIRNQLDAWFLRLLVSENNPDRATSGFIIDAIGNKGDTCLWRNAKFLIKDHGVPKGLSIHLFANTTAKKISSDEVRSMIIQLSGSPESYKENCEFLKFLFSKVSFKNLRCLMVCGMQLSGEFTQEIGALNLDVFHMRNFHYHINLPQSRFFRYCKSLKTLYVVHPDVKVEVDPPKELKKLVIYCPKSSKDMIERRRDFYTKLEINVSVCHALKEM